MFSKKIHVVIAAVLAIVAMSLLVQNVSAGSGMYTCKRIWGCRSFDDNGNVKYNVPLIPVDTKLTITRTKTATVTVKSWWSTTTKTVTLGQSQFGVAGSWYDLTDEFK